MARFELARSPLVRRFHGRFMFLSNRVQRGRQPAGRDSVVQDRGMTIPDHPAQPAEGPRAEPSVEERTIRAMGMLRVDYHVALLHVEDDLLRLGRAVEAAVVHATDALLQGDVDEASRIISRDDAIDLGTHEAEDVVHGLITRQAPIADELRLLLSLLSLARSIERIGDYTVNIAKLTRGLRGWGPDDLTAQIREMALAAERAVRSALDLFSRRDPRGVEQMAEVEDRLDRLRDGLIGRLMTHAAEGTGATEWAIMMIQVARHLERIGDHGVGIAEKGQWITTGERRPPRAARG